MKTVATTFTKNGFLHEQIRRTGNIAMYRRTKQGHAHVEVVKIGRHNGRVLPDGGEIPPGEFYPSAETWGTYGFTYADEAQAEAKFTEMVNAASQPPN